MAKEENNTQSNGDVIDFSNTDFNMDAFSMDAMQVEEEESSSEENDDKDTQVSDEGTPQESVANEETSKEETDETDDSEEDKEISGEGEDSDSSSGKLYSSLASALQEQGILSSLDPEKDKIESVEDLMEVFNRELSTREFSDLTDTQKEYVKALRNGIPEEEVKEYLSVTNDLNSITEDELRNNADLRQELIKQDFIKQGLNETKAAKLAKLSADSGEDEADALEALISLRENITKEYQSKLQAQEQAKLDAQKKQEEDLARLKKEVNSVKEIIPGLKLTSAEKEKLYEQMTKPAGQVNGQPISAIQKKRMENPMDFEVKLNYLFKITNGFENFDKIVKKTKSSSIKELEKQLKGNTFSPGGSGNTGDEFKTSTDFKGLAEGRII